MVSPSSEIRAAAVEVNDPRDLIISSYRNPVVRAYCTIRFQIINLRILEDLEQYLPQRGTILDLGCGFGLFSLFFALRSPERRLLSLDLNSSRISMARRSAEKLGVADRVEFVHRNILDHPFDQTTDGIVTLDLLHHIPTAEVPRILAHCHKILNPGGILLVKEVTSKPAWKAAFTWLLDKFMDPRTPVHYYSESSMAAMLRELGFTVRIHHLWDLLPYPHVLYVCTK